MRNRLKGIGQQMKWSVRDESLHSKWVSNCSDICQEYPELIEDAKPVIREAAETMLELELKFIDKMFEKGDLENLKKKT